MMQALYAHAARDLRLAPVGTPAPGPGEVRVRIARGGICGSDLHYFHNGGFGSVTLREPMILGHEVAGFVDSLGPDVTGLRAFAMAGDRAQAMKVKLEFAAC